MNINIQIKTNWFAATVTVDGKDIIIGMELLSTGWLVGGVEQSKSWHDGIVGWLE